MKLKAFRYSTFDSELSDCLAPSLVYSRRQRAVIIQLQLQYSGRYDFIEPKCLWLGCKLVCIAGCLPERIRLNVNAGVLEWAMLEFKLGTLPLHSDNRR